MYVLLYPKICIENEGRERNIELLCPIFLRCWPTFLISDLWESNQKEKHRESKIHEPELSFESWVGLLLNKCMIQYSNQCRVASKWGHYTYKLELTLQASHSHHHDNRVLHCCQHTRYITVAHLPMHHLPKSDFLQNTLKRVHFSKYNAPFLIQQDTIC